MNTDAHILPSLAPESPANTGPASDPAPAAGSEPLPNADPSQPRRNGKIAHLPKEQRDLINHSFDEGVTYDAVSRKLAAQGVSLNLKNLSDWFHGGYQDELRARERRAQFRESQDRLLQIARQDDAPALSIAGLRLAITQLSQQVYDLAPGSHQDSFQTNTSLYLRMLNTLARMSKSLLTLQKYDDESVKARTAELKQLDEDREFSDNEYLLLANRMDKAFKVKYRPHLHGVSKPPSNQAGIPRETVSPDSTSSLAPTPSSKIENPHPQIEMAIPPVSAPSPASGERERGEEVLPFPTPVAVASSIKNHPAPSGSTGGGLGKPLAKGDVDSLSLSPIENRKSKIENEICPHCQNPLPPRPPNGIRPDLSCQHCFNPLPFVVMPGAQPSEFCPRCHLLLPSLLPDGQRPASLCRCGESLPPPGMAAEQKADHCVECGAPLPAPLSTGERPSPHCPACGTSLPPPRPASAWVSEHCLFCAIHLPSPYRTRHRTRENCPNCGCPLPPVGGYPPQPPGPTTDSS